MEKILSTDERIRRAEEIYYRRKNQDINQKSTKVNLSNKKDFRMFRKVIFQISVCVLIYIIFYIVQNSNYIFSEATLKKINEILSYDINIKNTYVECSKYINSFSKNVGEAISCLQEENIEQNEVINIQNQESDSGEKIENKSIDSTKEESVGGEDIEVSTEEKTELSQMEQDAKNMLETKSLVIPLKGIITSRFGLRDPEIPTVPKNHTGIDIAANEGTVFVASMSGMVEEVSSKRRSRESF